MAMAAIADDCTFYCESKENDDYLLAKYLQDEEWSSNERQFYERDLAFALQLQQYLNESNESRFVKNDIFTVKGKKYGSLVDPELETVDPTPDVWHLFRDFDQHFFNSVLVTNGVLLEWSKRMTSCAGVCQWSSGQCFIRLSYPLLTLRRRSDLIETLLHEMIHAYLFVTRARDDGEHGSKFREHMFRINKEAKTHISVYHSFHEEVRHYQQHIWRCDGPCRTRGPYFGYVRRAINRQPGPTDAWWDSHRSSCTGKFIKISEPKESKVHRNPIHPRNSTKSTSKQTKIQSFMNTKRGNSLTDTTINGSKSLNNTSLNTPGNDTLFVPFSGHGHTLGTSSGKNAAKSMAGNETKKSSGKRFFLGTPPKKENQIRTVIAAKSSDSKSCSAEDQKDDILVTSFYENTDDDEFIRNFDFDLTSINQRKNCSTPSVAKYFPVSKKKQIDVLQID